MLFNSIDVRDLLPGDTAVAGEDDSPLSVPDLRLLIDRLQIRSDFIKSQAIRYLLSHRLHFQHIFSVSSHCVSLSYDASHVLDNLFLLLSSRRSTVDDAHRALSDLRFAIGQLSQKRILLHFVRIIASLNQIMATVQEDFISGLVVEAVEKMMDLKKAVRVTEVEEGEPAVYGLLRNFWVNKFDEIKLLLVKCMREAVRFDDEHNRIQVRYHLLVDGIGGIELRAVLDAIRVADIMKYGLAYVVDLIVEHVVTPVVRFGSSVSSVEKSAGHDLVLLPPSADPFSGDVNGEMVYSSVIFVVRFICNFLCFQNVEFVRIFGDLAWQKVRGLIKSEFLSKVAPDDDTKQTDFQRVVKQTFEFESVLREMMFIPDSEGEEDQLGSFARNLEERYASRKKNEFLAQARNLIMGCDFDIPKRPSVTCASDAREKDFGISSLVVSEAALGLVKLVHQTLQDSCSSSEAVGCRLYYAARDALILYEAIVPVKLEKRIQAVGHVAVLVHNDCMFLYSEVIRLASQYRPFLPISLKENPLFVDLSPRFLVLGDEILHGQIKLIIFNLNEAVDGADGFQNTHLMQRYESAKFSIDQVCFLLEKVHILWEPLLLPSTYIRNMCAILESVFARVVIEILLLDDIGAEETLQLQGLILSMLENTSSLVDSLVHPNQGAGTHHVSMDNGIPSLHKVRKLSELLDMPMKSITGEWESGELVKCGFTAEEVENFIKSTFTDTSFRKECIGIIRSTKST